MSSKPMPKPESDIPPEITEKLDQVIKRLSEAFADQLRDEVAQMFRFAGVASKGQIPREVIATMMLLEERGTPMQLDQVIEELKGGGIWRPATGAKGSTADSEMKRSISRAANHGVNIKFVDKEKEIIGLAERA